VGAVHYRLGRTGRRRGKEQNGCNLTRREGRSGHAMVRYRLHDTSIFEYAVIAEPKLNASVHNAAYRGYTLPPPATRLLIASRFGPENIRYWDVMSTAARLSPTQIRLRQLLKIVAKCLKEHD